MIRSVFMGTPEAAVPILDALRRISDVDLVVTRADKPRGRSKRPVSPPVKDAALEWDLDVAQPTAAAGLYDVIARVEPDVVVVAAYGRIIRPDLLSLPRNGFVNVHFSLLPRWRGASPVARAILAGDGVTGVALMVMDEGLDTGPVIGMVETEIATDDTTGTLTARLSDLGAEMVTTSLPLFLDGEISPTAQDDELATAAAKIETAEAFVDPELHSVEAVDRAIRAFNPKPGAWSIVDGERMKLWRAEVASGDGPKPGVAAVIDGEVLLGTRTGSMRLLEVQPSGKGPMEAAAWMNGRRGEPARFTR
jgi:methionyl-tRNA formyltransferase